LTYAQFFCVRIPLSSDGYLVLGAAETAVGLSDRFKMVSDKPGLYTLNTISPRLLAQPRTTHARPRLIAINGGRQNGSPQAKTPADGRGFEIPSIQAEIFASSSDGSRST
jgi:hypothetical protein